MVESRGRSSGSNAQPGTELTLPLGNAVADSCLANYESSTVAGVARLRFLMPAITGTLPYKYPFHRLFEPSGPIVRRLQAAPFVFLSLWTL
jgi:hypothetical protein